MRCKTLIALALLLPTALVVRAQGGAEAFGRGDFLTARQLANRAKTRFPTGSPGWVNADDIASYKPPRTAARGR